jgi:hypothetical protein
METIRKEAIREEIIEINYYILKAIHDGENHLILKYKIMLDNLITILLLDD